MSLLPRPVEICDAVVLRAWPAGETSVVASLLTAEVGFVRVIAKGARRTRSSLRPLIQVGGLIEAEFTWIPDRDLQYLQGGSRRLAPLQEEATLECHAYLLAALEIADRCGPVGVDAALLFDLCHDYVRMLSCASRGTEAALFYGFELALLHGQGVAPQLDRCVACARPVADSDGAQLWFRPAGGGAVCQSCGGGAGRTGDRPLAPQLRQALVELSAATRGRWSQTLLSRPVARELGIMLHHFLAYHLPGYRLPAALDLLRGHGQPRVASTSSGGNQEGPRR